VYKGVPMATLEDDDEKPKRRRLPGWLAKLRGKAEPTKAVAKPAAP